MSDIFAGKTHLCNCWAIERRDGEVFGFTDHDADLEFEGIVFRASSGLSAFAVQQTTGLSVDNTEAIGALSADVIRAEDLLAGRFDGASVRAWLVVWDEINLRQVQFRGTIGAISRNGPSFSAELRGLTEALNVSGGRMYHRACAHVFGSPACGVSEEAYRVTGSVETVEGSALGIRLDARQPQGWFARGRIEVRSGAARGLSATIKTDAEDGDLRRIALWSPFGRAPEIGDQVVLTAGCDKRFATCRDRFDNGHNFGGFPHIPGEDWLMSVPQRAGLNTGGSMGS